MKIKALSVQNVTSYNDEVCFIFDRELNILIGPNGGGKSNLQKILALVLSYFFFQQYDFQDNGEVKGIKIVELWGRRALQERLDRYLGNSGTQIITLEIQPEQADLDNISRIADNLGQLNQVLEYWEMPINEYGPQRYLDNLRSAQCLTYTIRNLTLDTDATSPEGAFREYLQTFNLFKRLAGRLDITLSSPIFFFFSERTFNRAQRLETQSLAENNIYSTERQAYQSAIGDNTNMFQLGAIHFLRLFRRAERKAANERGVIVDDLIDKDPDVQLLDKYIKRLGYDWGFHSDPDSISYEFFLKKNDQLITPAKFSSGEKEIVHLLLATFALNVSSGVVLIDEPELHLHPRWQKILLNLFRDLSSDRRNQLIIATHSPVFVTPETMNSVTRIYRSNSGSRRVCLNEVELPQKRSLVQMINSHNNERLFFADKVILVEGLKDKLIISSLVANASDKFAINQAIEIIDVGGKNNFPLYRSLLQALDTSFFIIADKDYLEEVGSTDVKSLFVQDDAGAWRSLIDKKSVDGASLRRSLRQAIQSGNLEELRKLSDYLDGRQRRIKSDLSAEEDEAIKRDISAQTHHKVWILPRGEIEDYLPPGSTQLNRIIDLLADKDWLRNTATERSVELLGIVFEILDLDSRSLDAVLESWKNGGRFFGASVTSAEAGT